MTIANVTALRIALGATTAVAVSYAGAWPLSYMVPLFTVMFLSMPGPWFGWKVASQIMRRLVVALFCGLLISEFFLRMPLVCVPLYALLFFYIFFKDATAPPLSTIFMTMGITMVPILGLQGTIAAHFISGYLFVNMALAFVFTWLFHLFIPASMAKQVPNAPAPKRPTPPPIPSREERARLALVSTVVATSAVLIFFAFNLAQYALAMLYICMMAGTPTTNASIKVLKANSMASFVIPCFLVIKSHWVGRRRRLGCLDLPRFWCCSVARLGWMPAPVLICTSELRRCCLLACLPSVRSSSLNT